MPRDSFWTTVIAILKIFLHCLDLLEFFASPLGTIAFCLSLLASLGVHVEYFVLPMTFSLLLWTEKQELEF